jgi:hypothetical protein
MGSEGKGTKGKAPSPVSLPEMVSTQSARPIDETLYKKYLQDTVPPAAALPNDPLLKGKSKQQGTPRRRQLTQLEPAPTRPTKVLNDYDEVLENWQ